MSATGTQLTKGQRMAQSMQEQLGRVIVPVAGGNIMGGADGRTTVSKVAAERIAKLEAAREAQRALDAEADKDAQPAKAKKAKRIPAALNLVPTPKASKKKATAPVLEVLTDVTFKVCPRCKVSKPLTAEFWARDSSSKSGFYSICKADEKLDRDAKKAAAALPVAATPGPKGKKRK